VERMIIAEPDNNSCSGEFDTSDRVVYVACGSVQLILMFALIFYTQVLQTLHTLVYNVY
jgi:hypothetical protein